MIRKGIAKSCRNEASRIFLPNRLGRACCDLKISHIVRRWEPVLGSMRAHSLGSKVTMF